MLDMLDANIDDGLDETAAPEDIVIDDDLVLQRYNSQLPPSYRAHLDAEQKLLIRALRVIVKAVAHDNDASASAPNEGPTQATSEGYQHEIEKDLAALEKGLSRYVDLKHPFDPSDYPTFINALLRGALTPSIDMGLRSKLARCASRVLSKRHCALPDGVAWRPIVAQILRMHVDCVDGGPFIGKELRETHCRNFVSVLSKCRNFLTPDDSAENIWNHFLPGLNHTDPDVQYKELLFLSYLLPTRGDSWSGWVTEGMRVWQCFDASSDWDSIWMALFGRLARHQPCIVDWTPYLSWVYTRVTDAFHLPLGAMAAHGSIDRRCPYQISFLEEGKLIPMAAVFAVYSLSPQRPESFEYLKRLFNLIANYFHPSNNGRWSNNIGSFLAHISGTLASRITDEQHAAKAGVSKRVIGDNTQKGVAPAEHRLTENCITQVTDILQPLVELGLHAKVTGLSVQAATASRDLALISPDKVVVPLIANAAEGLESISSPHRTTAALRVLAGLTPIFLDPGIFPGGGEYLPQALELTLPGIDPNDPSKTEATLRFIAGAAARIQGSTSSDRSPVSADFLEDYVRQLFDRIFIFLDSLESPPKKTVSGYTSVQSLSFFIFSVTVENVFAALPSNVVLSAARIISRQLLSNTCSNALKYYGALVRTASAAVAASTSDGSAVELFVQPLLNQILEDSDEVKDGVAHALVSVGEDDLVWRIRLLAQACRTCGTGLETHLDKISVVIRLAFDKNERPIYKAGGRLLRGVLEGLTSIQMDLDVGKTEPDRTPEDEIYKFDWNVPTTENWSSAEDLVKTFVARAEKMCVSGDELTTDREALFRTLRLLHAIQRGGRWLFAGAQPDHYRNLDKYLDDGVQLSKKDAKLILKRPIVAGLGGEEHTGYGRERASSLWQRVYSLILKLMKEIVAKFPDDAALLYRCLEPIELAHEPLRRGYQSRPTMQASRSYKAAYKPVIAQKRPFGSEGGVGRAMPRFIVKLRIEAHHQMRLTIAARPGMNCPDLCEELFNRIAVLSLNDFPRVRSEAKGVLTRTMRVMKPDIRKKEITRIINVLRTSTSSENSTDVVMGEANESSPDAQTSLKKLKKDVVYEKMIGASSILRSSAAAPLIMRDLTLFGSVIHALLEAIPKAERPDAAGAVGSLFAKLSALVRPLSLDNIQLIGPDLNPDGLDSEKLLNTEKRKAYDDLYGSLLALLDQTGPARAPTKDGEVADKQNDHSGKKAEVHWRVQSLVATVLYIMVREDKEPPAAIAEFFARGMASDVVSLRSICVKGVMLLLALHGRKAGVAHKQEDTMDDSPSAWKAAGYNAIEAIGNVVCAPGYARKLIHTLALDHEDEISENGRRGQSVASFAVMNAGRVSDGDSLWMFSGGRPWPTSWTPRSRDHLNIVRMRVYESLVRVFGPHIVKDVLANVDELVAKLERKEERLIGGVKDEDVRVLAGEVLAGVCRGLDVVHCRDETKEAELVNLTWRLLNDMTGSVGIVNGATLIRLLTTADSFTVGPRVMKVVTEKLLQMKPLIVSMGDGPHAHLQARRLRYLHSCVADLDDGEHSQMRLIADATIEPLANDVAFNHEMKTVREEVARFLSLVAVNISQESDSKFTEVMDGLRRELETVEDKMIKFEANSAADTSMENGEAPENEYRKSRSRQGETLSRFISIVYWNGRARGFEGHIAKFLPVLFKSFDESDSERISHARMALSFIAQGAFTQETIDAMISSVEQTARDSRWKVRASVLSFLQVLSFSCLFSAKPESHTRIRAVVFNLLSDAQLEVRQGAASAFVTMIRDATDEAVDEMRGKFMKLLRETAPKRKGGRRGTLNAETAVRRHGAVLGLSSMVTSSPYSVPQWMPSVLVALSGCINDAPPISTGVRELFGDFMRTHRDEWATHKEAFSPDELDTVLELLVSPSHYA